MAPDLPADAFGFQFECVQTDGRVFFIQVGSRSPANEVGAGFPAGDALGGRQARLRQLSPLLRRALAAAAERAQLRQAQLRGEDLLDELATALAQAEAMAHLLRYCLTPAEVQPPRIYWGRF